MPSRGPPSPLLSPALPLSLPDSIHCHVPVNRSLKRRREGVPGRARLTRKSSNATSSLSSASASTSSSCFTTSASSASSFSRCRSSSVRWSSQARVLSSWTASCSKTTGVRRGSRQPRHRPWLPPPAAARVGLPGRMWRLLLSPYGVVHNISLHLLLAPLHHWLQRRTRAVVEGLCEVQRDRHPLMTQK